MELILSGVVGFMLLFGAGPIFAVVSYWLERDAWEAVKVFALGSGLQWGIIVLTAYSIYAGAALLGLDIPGVELP